MDGITIVGLGEALWDLLPSGKQLGGAPLNVAVHAQQLLRGRGKNSSHLAPRDDAPLAKRADYTGCGVVASRVGSDPLGDELVAELLARQMTADFVQRDPSHATGTVRVTLEKGQPRYEIVEDVAWDCFEFTPTWEQLASGAAAICFGSLAQRSGASRGTIEKFLDAAQTAIRLFDVNLRQKFFSRDVIDGSCRRATLVKLNEEELPVLAKLLGLSAGAPVFQLAQLRARYELDAVVYTRGRRGTMLVLDDKVITPPAVSYPFAADADSVGAGDACAAGILVGWSLGLPRGRIAELANHLGAFVASRRGATPQLPPEILQLITA
jgi:fructokinase